MSSSSARTPPAEGRPIPRRALASGLFALTLSAACGAELPAARPRQTWKPGQRVDPAELFPADLDLVVRFDVGRMRAELGPVTDALSARLEAEDKSEEPIVAAALRRARVVWIGLRLADLDAGDRVLVVEGDVEDVRPDKYNYEIVDPPVADGLKSFERKGSQKRSATSRIHVFGGRAIAFVTPVEVDSVDRVIQRGPDERRRDPSAEGLVSADLRVRGLPPSLERRFRSIGSILRGVVSARANATMVAGGFAKAGDPRPALSSEALRVELEITAASDPAAKKVEGLLLALREGGQGSRYAALFDDLRIERVERTLRVRWTFAAEALRVLSSASTDVEDPR